MNELEVWICSCKTERTWGARTNLHHSDSAWLFCESCQRMTLHLFAKTHRVKNAGQFTGWRPAAKWKSGKASPNFGWSNAIGGQHYRTERH